jgi:hypothetical protein
VTCHSVAAFHSALPAATGIMPCPLASASSASVCSRLVGGFQPLAAKVAGL